MDFIPLLNLGLKSDPILELLELWDCEVVYDFDRNHENIPDKYWARAEEEGVLFRFDEDQQLRCIFLHVTTKDGFSSIDLTSTDIHEFETIEKVRSYASQNNISISNGHTTLFGQPRDWARLEFDDHWVHYEFRDGVLAVVTLTAA